MVTNAEDLERATDDFFRSNAEAFGLDPSRIAVSFVLNWGGFVNFSYHVSDGRTRLHVKLSATQDGQSALQRWHDLDSLLRQYHSPPVLAQVDVGAAKGLVFPRLGGGLPTHGGEVVGSALACATKLWADAELGARLWRGRTITAADCYAETYHDRFTADLDAVQAALPPFLRSTDLEYLRTEVDGMERRIRDATAFRDEVRSPIHGDLWLNNVMWESRESWWLLDWDDLRIGDPAMDLATLTGPTSRDLRPLKRIDLLEAVVTPEVRERLTLLGRAALLDWVIDPLADWIEATVAPGQQEEVRLEKERVHREALTLYRELYPG